MEHWVGSERYEDNFSKTEVTRVNRGQDQGDGMINEHRLNRVRSFKYLGVKFHEKEIQSEEITHRINKYNENVSVLIPLCKESSILQTCKTTTYTTISRPILIYRSEAWSLTTTQKSCIQAAEMRVLKLLAGVSQIDRIRNVTQTKSRSGCFIGCDREGEAAMVWKEKRFPRVMLNWIPEGRCQDDQLVDHESNGWIEWKKDWGILEERTYEDRSNWGRIVRGQAGRIWSYLTSGRKDEKVNCQAVFLSNLL